MTNNNIREMSYNPVTVGVIIGIVMLAYAFGPFDFVPDFALGYGQIDDGIVLTIGSILEIINLIYGLNHSRSNQETSSSYRDYVDNYSDYREI